MQIIPELRRSIHPARDWSSYRQLLKLLRAKKPEIVHTHSSKAGIMGRAAAAHLGIPAVHTMHGASFHVGQNPLAHRLYRAAEKWAARRGARFISVCDAMTDHYVSAGIATRDRFFTIYSGMEVEPFLNPPRPRELVRQELGFETRARRDHEGGPAVSPQGARVRDPAAANVVVRQHPNVRFLFVGDGNLREPFPDAYRTGRARADKFVFTGLVPPSKVPESIHASDIIVHTSLWEGLARVLPQALIAGKPVVSYDVDGAREVVIPGETGYLLPPQSVERTGHRIDRVGRRRGTAASAGPRVVSGSPISSATKR